ncbi:hypothetical protein QFZ99_005001 [Paraburkholderia atlantica]|uniref:Uncharacterized protein n=1 Tax=Paraburkholderia atlantica TaxID=2654982 RepID=A0A7W8V4T6_PARAM|nr:hypothetical protein [Paraburkholderia atlantica]
MLRTLGLFAGKLLIDCWRRGVQAYHAFRESDMSVPLNIGIELPGEVLLNAEDGELKQTTVVQ